MVFKKAAKGLTGLLGAGAVALGMSGSADGGTLGYLKIENNLNSNSRSVEMIRDDEYFPGASDNHDSYDGEANAMPSGYPNIYSDITTHNLWSDVRAENTTSVYDIKLGFEGSLSEKKENWLDFSFPYDNDGDLEFNGMPIYLQKKEGGVLTGPIYDVRDIVDNHSGRLDLPDVPAGSYGQWEPYSEYVLDIGANLIPEPSTLSLLGIAGAAGAAATGLRRRRRRDEGYESLIRE
jgi:hypothetical protein